MKTAQHIPDAIRFAPLRVAQDGPGSWGVWTRDDRTPGSLNNFEVAQCQFKDDAVLFAAVPTLIAALESLLIADQLPPSGEAAERQITAMAKARAALALAKGGEK
jgi:hypothetical protein